MDIFTSLKVSSSALTVQRYRMNIISSNLANIETIETKEGGPYKRKEIVVTSEEVSNNFKQILDHQLSGAVKEVKIQGYIDDDRPPVAKYDPSNPEADPDGYVRYPNINIIEELTNLTMASRNYESNVTVISTTKRLALQTLEIGK